MKTRRLTSFCKDEYITKKYRVCFSYYDENGNWTNEYEEGSFTEDELYNLLKGRLKYIKSG